jgi:ribA/ribD-fused uncharacterized protein
VKSGPRTALKPAEKTVGVSPLTRDRETRMRRIGDLTLFFGKDDPPSNWHPAPFVVKGIEFPTNEHFMMYCKARLFGDEQVAAAILGDDAAAWRALQGTERAAMASRPAGDPARAKALGRAVRRFDAAAWEARCRGYVKTGARAKFTQHLKLLADLLATAGTLLVEASPYDRVWGVGLSASDPRIRDRAKWRGENRLGHLLTDLREELLNSADP